MSDRIIFALIGALIGGIAGSIVSAKLFGKDYRKRIEELEQINKQLRAKENFEKRMDISIKEKRVKAKEEDLDASLASQLSMAREEREKTEELIQSHGYSPEDEDGEFDSEEDVEFQDPFDGEEVVVKAETKKEPSFKMMTQEDYEEDYEYRDSECLTYYQEDHVLADAFDDRVGNPEMIIGKEAVLQADNTDGEFVYVLDEVEDKMYEIEINHEDSYYRDVVRGGL